MKISLSLDISPSLDHRHLARSPPTLFHHAFALRSDVQINDSLKFLTVCQKRRGILTSALGLWERELIFCTISITNFQALKRSQQGLKETVRWGQSRFVFLVVEDFPPRTHSPILAEMSQIMVKLKLIMYPMRENHGFLQFRDPTVASTSSSAFRLLSLLQGSKAVEPPT